MSTSYDDEFRLPDADLRALILNLGRVRKERGFSEEEGICLVGTANAEFRVWKLFEATIRGIIDVDVQDGEVVFQLPSDRDAPYPENLKDQPEQHQPQSQERLAAIPA